MKMQRIEGNTYEVRDKLKELGAKWDPEDKHWWIEAEKIEQANAIVGAAPPAPPKKQRKAIHARCPVCGTEFDV